MFRSIFAVAIGLVAVSGGAAAAQEIPLDKITLPPGFSIAVYASGVPNARSMALSPTGTLFVSTRRAGDVYAVCCLSSPCYSSLPHPRRRRSRPN